jgi:outer membrane protein TolC
MWSLAQLRLGPLGFLAGCTVGPDFTTPPPPDVQSLTPGPLRHRVVADGKVQRFVDDDLPGQWWTLFRSRALTELMQRAVRDNHDLKAAQAALRVARANYEAQKGALFPVISVSEASSLQKVATADLSAPTVSGDPYFTLHTAQLTVSYVPDAFGGIRRQVEAASAQEEAQQFALEATYLNLTSNIALAVIQEASLNEQIRETRAAIDAEQMLADGETYAAANFESASTRDWADLRSAKAQAEQTKPLLQKQLAAQRDLLAAPTGNLPVLAWLGPSPLPSCSCQETCRSCCRRRSSTSDPTCARPKPICVPPAPWSAWPSQTGFRCSTSPETSAAPAVNSTTSETRRPNSCSGQLPAA